MRNNKPLVTLANSEPLRFFAVFIVALLIVTLRNSFNEVFYPTLPAEDGKFLFQVFYNNHELTSVFKFYSGYISLLPNLLAYLLTFLPVTLIPSSFALTSLLITALAYSLFYPALAALYKDRLFAFYVAAVISALPLGNWWLIGALSYQSWNFMIILFLLLFLPIPKNRINRTAYVAAVNLLIWSHPLSVLTLPIYVFKLVKNREGKFENALFSASAFLYFLLGMEPGALAWPGFPALFQLFATRVLAEALAGPRNRMIFHNEGDAHIFPLLLIVSVSTAAALFYFSWRERRDEEKEFLAALVYFLGSSFVIAMLSRVASRNLGEEFLGADWGTQYVYLPKIFLITLFLLSFHNVWKRSAAYRFIGIGFAAILFCASLNSSIVYKTQVDNGKQVLKFVRIIADNKLDCAAGDEKFITLRKGDVGTENQPANFNVNINLCAQSR